MNPAPDVPKEAAADRELVITRVFDAPRHLVYEAWTKKAHLDRWCMPKDFTLVDTDGDVRPGGAWYSQMRAPNGEEYRAAGHYQEVVENELLSFTHAWDGDDGEPEHVTLVTVRFTDEADGKTRMHFRQATFRSTESCDGHREVPLCRRV